MAFLLIGLLILIAAYFICFDQETFTASIFGYPLIAIGYGILVLGAISSTSFLYKKGSAITTKIAGLSYAIYLTHKIIIHITQQQFSKLNLEKDTNSMFLICIITCFAGAMLMNMLIEKPFLQLRGKLLKAFAKR